MALPYDVHLTLPAWTRDVANTSAVFTGDAAKVRLAVELSRRNVVERSGGPFGAVVFGPDDRVVSVGVNVVLPLACSMAHAEVMAFMLAQQALGRARLNRDAGRPVGPFTLATSSQPCCQCYGAAVWAGIDRLLIGARAEDVVTLTTFDEGPLPADWVHELERRGVGVERDLCRDEACDVLRMYREAGGPEY